MSKKDQDRDMDFIERMKRLRAQRNMSFEELAQESGYDVEYLKRVEAGEETPPVSAVIQISRALSVDAGKFLSAPPEKKESPRASAYKKRTSEYAYETLTPKAADKHMKAFRVTIDPQSEHKMVAYHHVGEEFIYMLEGTLDIQVGRRKRKLNKGQSIHFNSEQTHKLSNPGKKQAVLIVVIYTP